MNEQEIENYDLTDKDESPVFIHSAPCTGLRQVSFYKEDLLYMEKRQVVFLTQILNR